MWELHSPSSYTAPSGYESKWHVWNIISQIFDPVWKMLSDYIIAFQNIIDSDNTVPVWNSTTQVFDVGTITDTGVNVWIWMSNPSEKLSIDGRLSVTGIPNSDDDVWSRLYNDGRYINIWDSINGDTIEDGTLDSSEIQDNSIISWDIRDGTIRTDDISSNSIVRPVWNTSLVWPRSWRDWSWDSAGSGLYPHNMFLWYYAWYKITTGSNNIFLWRRSGYEVTSSTRNTFIWALSWSDTTTWGRNTFIGLDAWRWNTTGSNNIAIGAYSTLPNPTSSNQLSIWNRIYGLANGNIGIWTSTPSQRLEVAGKIKMTTQTQSTDSDDTVATKGYVDDAFISQANSPQINEYYVLGVNWETEKEMKLPNDVSFCSFSWFKTTADDQNMYDSCRVYKDVDTQDWKLSLSKHSNDTLECRATCVKFGNESIWKTLQRECVMVQVWWWVTNEQIVTTDKWLSLKTNDVVNDVYNTTITLYGKWNWKISDTCKWGWTKWGGWRYNGIINISDNSCRNKNNWNGRYTEAEFCRMREI